MSSKRNGEQTPQKKRLEVTSSNTAAPDALLYKLAFKFLRQGYLLTYWLPFAKSRAADTVSLSGCVSGPIAGYLWSDSRCSLKVLLHFNQKNKHTAVKTNQLMTIDAPHTVFVTHLSSIQSICIKGPLNVRNTLWQRILCENAIFSQLFLFKCQSTAGPHNSSWTIILSGLAAFFAHTMLCRDLV